MSSRLLNEELSKIKHLFNYEMGDVISEQEKLKKKERQEKFNKLIKDGDDDIKFVDNYVDLDKEITSKDGGKNGWFRIGNNRVHWTELKSDVNGRLNRALERYEAAKLLYSDLPKRNRNIENNLSIVDEKIKEVNSYLTKSENFMANLKKIVDEREAEKQKEHGYELVDKVDLPNGEYNGAGGGDGYIIRDKNGEYTGYLVITSISIRGDVSDDKVVITNGVPTSDTWGKGGTYFFNPNQELLYR